MNGGLGSAGNPIVPSFRQSPRNQSQAARVILVRAVRVASMNRIDSSFIRFSWGLLPFGQKEVALEGVKM